ncbi:hypothetical protein [Cellulomonas sp. FA1]|uniref:hypothetical protein n=1 Tax=Cellulomonas sp. FA1 TaxID=1346710 RepID=UPI000ADD4740|nr:hypothetical protein [Cellulomonas sp. FA1]
MRFPTPTNPAQAPVWENYIVSQAVQATLGQIPVHALAVGVQVAGSQVSLRFQLSECSEADRTDMEDIVSELEALVGEDVRVRSVGEVRPERSITAADGLRWIFLARA